MLRLIWFAWNKVLRPRRFLQDFPSFTDVFVASSAINDLPYFLQIGTREYRLTAAVIHMGHTIHHGHYVADVRINNQWMRCNDDKVICSCGWENDTLFDTLFAFICGFGNEICSLAHISPCAISCIHCILKINSSSICFLISAVLIFSPFQMFASSY